MPIRFRCPHCTRLLGIARRKAGSQINCPQCARPVTVPVQEDAGDLVELENLLGSAAAPATAGAPVLQSPALPEPEPARPAVAFERGQPAAARPVQPPVAARPPAARPPSRRHPSGDDPLFEQDDVDVLLGVKKTGPLELDDEPAAGAKPGPKPVSGLDAMSLDQGPGKIILSSQKATLLVVAVVVLLGVAFAAGFLIASNL